MLKLMTTTAFSIAVLIGGFALQAHAAGPRPGQDPIDWCVANGGEIIPQRPGAIMQACCTDEGCIICDGQWQNCVFDPAYNQHTGTMTPDGVRPGEMTQPGRTPTLMTTDLPGLFDPLMTR